MRNKKAFTLIELLIVIAIIGIIATLAIVALQQARQNARDAKRVADVKQMSTALEMYFNEHQSYPDSIEDLKEAGYMQMIPEAPTPADKGCEDSNDYEYSTSPNKDYYQLRFCTGKQVADLSPGNLCMTPGGLSTNCSTTALAPDPDPFCDPNESVTFVDENNNGYLDIHTCCELSAIRNNPSANYELVNNLDCSNVKNWAHTVNYGGPFGYTADGFFPMIKHFEGNLNGNNYAIDGLFFKPVSFMTTNSEAGLLTVASGADVSISNLKITNSELDVGSNQVSAFLAPSVFGSLSISNVSLVNALALNLNSTMSGGFVGSSAYGSDIVIENSHIKGLEVSHGGNSPFGGMIGNVSGGSFSINNSSASNLVVDSTSGFGGLVGRSSSLFDSTISNSRVLNSDITCSFCSGVGGLIHNTTNLTIENSYTNNMSISNSGNAFGGLVGYYSEDSSNSIISNSYVSKLSANSSGAGVGGLVGHYNSGSSNNVIVNSRLVNSEIICTNCGGIGGLVIESRSLAIEDSYVSGVDFDSRGGGGAGGMIYWAFDTEIIDSYVKNSNFLEPGGGASGAGSGYAGLLISGSNVNISGSYADNISIRPKSSGCGSGMVCSLSNGNITNSYVSNLDIANDVGSGGLFGLASSVNNSTVSNAYVMDSAIDNVCNITVGLINSVNNSTINNSHVINTDITSLGCSTSGAFGQLADSAVGNSSFKGGTVSVVSGSGTTSGFAGYVSSSSSILNSFSDAVISASYSSGSNNTVAGFISRTDSGGDVAKSYFSGEITGNADYRSCFAVSSGSVSQSYYNSDKCTFGDSKATGLSDAQMKDPSLYSGWNINTPSCDGADDNNPWRWTSGNYPCLYSDLTCSCS